jgi:hypothetical protein
MVSLMAIALDVEVVFVDVNHVVLSTTEEAECEESDFELWAYSYESCGDLLGLFAPLKVEGDDTLRSIRLPYG